MGERGHDGRELSARNGSVPRSVAALPDQGPRQASRLQAREYFHRTRAKITRLPQKIRRALSRIFRERRSVDRLTTAACIVMSTPFTPTPHPFSPSRHENPVSTAVCGKHRRTSTHFQFSFALCLLEVFACTLLEYFFLFGLSRVCGPAVGRNAFFCCVFARQVTQLSESPMRSPLAVCLLIRYMSKILHDDISATNARAAYQVRECYVAP